VDDDKRDYHAYTGKKRYEMSVALSTKSGKKGGEEMEGGRTIQI
jgi:hypothetical protein